MDTENKMKIGFFDGTTGEQIVREATAQEIAERNNEIETFSLEDQARLAEAEEILKAKKQAIIKLTELGIDPKAFGLQTDEATAL